MQVVLIFLSCSILLTPKADVRTCTQFAHQNFYKFCVMRASSLCWLSIVLHSLLLSLFNRFTATEHPQQMLNVTLLVQWPHYFLKILSFHSLNFGKYRMVYLTYYSFLLLTCWCLPAMVHHYGGCWWPCLCSGASSGVQLRSNLTSCCKLFFRAR